MKVKLGELDYVTEVQPVLEGLVDEVIALSEKSTYPDKVDSDFAESLITQVHMGVLNESV